MSCANFLTIVAMLEVLAVAQPYRKYQHDVNIEHWHSIRFDRESSGDGESEADEEDNSVCKDSFCGKAGYESILKTYDSIFFTKERLYQIDEESRKLWEERMRKEGVEVDTKTHLVQGDGDMCCATQHTHKVNYTLTNMDNVTRYVIHFPDYKPEPMFQYISHGLCVEYGSCSGTCIQETTVQFVLVYDTSGKNFPPVTLDRFEIPTYCSCKNIA